MKKIKKNQRNIFAAFIFVILVSVPFVINGYIKFIMEPYIISADASFVDRVDCILILGGGLKSDGTPNYMLQDRLDKGISLYKAGTSSKLLLSGDNGQVQYDEANAMKAYVLERGIPVENVFLDHAGFSTYESIYRAKYIFQVKKAIIITQRYHQYRALYAARGFGIDAYGVAADPRVYSGQRYRELREVLARNKDFLMMLIKPEPTYLGDVIPINGNGLASHD